MVVAAMNSLSLRLLWPSYPALYLFSTVVARYLSKVSGPLLNRIDLHVDVMPVEYEHLSSSEKQSRLPLSVPGWKRA